MMNFKNWTMVVGLMNKVRALIRKVRGEDNT